MGYYCDVCDNFIEPKSKYKHFLYKFHISLNSYVIERYYMASHKYEEVEKIFRNYIFDYRNKFNHFHIIVEWKIVSK